MNRSRPLRTRLFWVCLGTALVAGFLGQAILALYPQAFASHWFRNAPVLLSLHLSTLGFLGLLVLGVLTQFLPMLLGRGLASERAVAPLLASFFGSALLLWCFFAAHRHAWLAAVAGAGLGLSLGSFVALAVPALVGGGGHRLTRVTLASSLAYFLLTALLGSLMAQGLVGQPLLRSPALALIELHLHLGLFGFAAFMVFAVSYELLPMFGLARNFTLVPGWVALGLGHAGIMALALAALQGSPVGARLWPWLLTGACAAWLLQVCLITRSSLRRQAEAGPTQFRVAAVFLLVAALWGLGLKDSEEPDPGRSAAYVYLLLFGFAGGAILGQLQKIIPLLTWYDRFADLAGKAKVPSAGDLLPRQGAWAVLILHSGACISGFLGLSFRLPLLLALAGLLGCATFVAVAYLWQACRSTAGLSIPRSDVEAAHEH